MHDALSYRSKCNWSITTANTIIESYFKN
jgi:hypothetical protein